jgi:4'-phosphopantetheinyl transferase
MAHHSPEILLRCMSTKDLDDADMANNAALLDIEESSRLTRLMIAEDRRDYAAAHALLRRTLTEAAPHIEPGAWCFERTARGKPFLPSPQAGTPPMRFSLSHTRGLVACIVSRRAEVGVDVESRSRPMDVDLLMREVCSADEQQQIRTAPASARADRFFDLWILKESYLKAVGLGITGALNKISFDLRTPEVIVASTPDEATNRWWFALIGEAAGGRAGVAVATDSHEAPVLDAAMIDPESSPPRLSPIAVHASSPAVSD